MTQEQLIPAIVSLSIQYLHKFPNTQEGAYYKFLEKELKAEIPPQDMTYIRDYVSSAITQLFDDRRILAIYNNDKSRFDGFALFMTSMTTEEIVWIFNKITSEPVTPNE